MPRPYILCHMLTSLDGKTTGDFLVAHKSLPDSGTYEKINTGFQAQACLSGRISMEENFTFFQKPQFDAHAARYLCEDYIAPVNTGSYMVSLILLEKLAGKKTLLIIWIVLLHIL